MFRPGMLWLCGKLCENGGSSRVHGQLRWSKSPTKFMLVPVGFLPSLAKNMGGRSKSSLKYKNQWTDEMTLMAINQIEIRLLLFKQYKKRGLIHRRNGFNQRKGERSLVKLKAGKMYALAVSMALKWEAWILNLRCPPLLLKLHVRSCGDLYSSSNDQHIIFAIFSTCREQILNTTLTCVQYTSL